MIDVQSSFKKYIVRGQYNDRIDIARSAAPRIMKAVLPEGRGHAARAKVSGKHRRRAQRAAAVVWFHVARLRSSGWRGLRLPCIR